MQAMAHQFKSKASIRQGGQGTLCALALAFFLIRLSHLPLRFPPRS